MATKSIDPKVDPKQTQLSELRKENRKLRAKLNEMAASSATWKEKCRTSQKQNAKKKPLGITAPSLQLGIERHKYDQQLVSLCVNIYVLGRTGFRGVINILAYLNKTLDWGLADLPAKSSVENWVLKAGYHLYQTIEPETYPDGYGLLLDECMVVGQERLMAVLAVPASKTGTTALALGDVALVGLQVKPSWDGASIAHLVDSIAQKMGCPPSYVISDGSNNLKNGLVKAGVVRVCDSGHQLALLAEQTYKHLPAFVAFQQAMRLCQVKEVMKPTAYLLPPKQRTIARFMNLSTTVEWAKKMLGIEAHFTEGEQVAFGFLAGHRVLIAELSRVYGLVNELLGVLKAHGLSHATIRRCLTTCRTWPGPRSGTLRQLMGKVRTYLQLEQAKLPTAQTSWHASTDILESLFGVYKSRQASNALHGVTPFVLSLALVPKVDRLTGSINLDFKQALEGVYLSDLSRWSADNLLVNQAVRRNKAFAM